MVKRVRAEQGRPGSDLEIGNKALRVSEGGHLIAGRLNLNPNNSPQNEFRLTLPDGSTIKRDDLIQSYAGYAGPATRLHIKPKGSGRQGGLLVDGAPYELDNSNAYDIISGAMTVRLYNDRVDKKGRAMGQWWISIAATNATITVADQDRSTLNAAPSTNFYVWGLDLSGSLQGAGGVGGLLSVTRSTSSGTATYYPCYDGNGNISDYVDTNGTVVAHREYDPFGNTVVSTGPMKDDFSFWFSTKYLDKETGLYYYGYRYYSPNLHIWLARDPIGDHLLLRSGHSSSDGHEVAGKRLRTKADIQAAYTRLGCARFLEQGQLAEWLPASEWESAHRRVVQGKDALFGWSRLDIDQRVATTQRLVPGYLQDPLLADFIRCIFIQEFQSEHDRQMQQEVISSAVLSTYVFVLNTPLTRVDALGLLAIQCVYSANCEGCCSFGKICIANYFGIFWWCDCV